MAKLTKEDLIKIKKDTARKMSLRYESASVKIRVHMGASGIAAGARDIMAALMTEMAQTDRQDIRLFTSGCIDMCSSEPNVTIEIENEPPVVYKKMSPEKIRRVFQKHVLTGEVQTDFI